MATVIRFSRHGTKKKPYYRIVVQDKTSPRDGKFIDHIGSYDPLKNDAITLQRDRLEYWLSVGAQLSTSVKNRIRGVRKQWAQGNETAAAPVTPVKRAPKAVETAPAPTKEA